MTYPRPKRSLGQNFLVDQQLADAFVAGLGVWPSANVLEVGPGRGALTKRLVMMLEAEGTLRLVEKDDIIAERLAKEYSQDHRVTVVHEDILGTDLVALADDGPWLVLGNLPYNVAGRIAMALLETRSRDGEPLARQMVLGFQREVAQRFTARPGDKAYNALSVMVSTLARCRKLFDLPPEAYRPQPKVWSQALRIDPRHDIDLGQGSWEGFRAFVHAAFTHRRKTIVNALKDHELCAGIEIGSLIREAEIEPGVRAQDIGPAQFQRMFRVLEMRSTVGTGRQ